MNGLDNDLHYCMDYDFWLRAGKQFRIERIPGILAQLRMYQDCKTMAGQESRWHEFFSIVESNGGAVTNLQQAQCQLDLGKAKYREGNIGIALRHFLRAAWLDPALLCESGFLKWVLRSLSGKRAIAWARERKQRRAALDHPGGHL